MNSVTKSFVEVSIVVDGIPLPIYQSEGRYWIAGETGKPYRILVRSSRPGRCEVLESVDGCDVLRDEPAAYRNSGMVIRDRWENRGWRLNDNEVREFVFSDPSSAIAAQATGSTANVGVIGVVVFTEKPLVYNPPTYTFTSAASFNVPKSLSASRAGGQSVMDSADLGTAMGALHQDAVGRTDFTRDSSIPAVAIEIQYRSHDWLVAQGIIVPAMPNAWPANSDTGYSKYAKYAK